jgi:DNA replication protein DnaC
LSENETKKWDCSEAEVQLPEKTFTFDHILVDQDQKAMYDSTARDTVMQYTKGFNGTIFAYGQSGSGKTFSMLGPEEVVSLIKSGEKISEEV